MLRIRKTALISLCLLTLSACSTERIVTKPVPVEVVRVERIPVPDDFLTRRNKTPVPDGITYGEAMELWARDRTSLDALNGQLAGIATLGDPDDGNSDNDP